MFKFLSRLGDSNEREIRALQPIVETETRRPTGFEALARGEAEAELAAQPALAHLQRAAHAIVHLEPAAAHGLHQAVEAKEGVKIERENQTLATITLQNYFRMYNKLAGMTGTAETEAGEFWQIYKLDVVVIPTNRTILIIDPKAENL